MIGSEANNEARLAILKSIRDHLVVSAPYNTVHEQVRAVAHHAQHRQENGGPPENTASCSVSDLFRENLQAVNGECILANGQVEVVQALGKIIDDLRDTPLQPRRVALSDAPIVKHLVDKLELDLEQIAVSPDATQLFDYDVGITTAQAAIAETATLVLESDRERHRLVSLLPPIHIAIIDSDQICQTLGEALASLRREGEALSPTITFITGPSRTADIELTLAIGVHGPQKLYVIVNTGPKLAMRVDTVV